MRVDALCLLTGQQTKRLPPLKTKLTKRNQLEDTTDKESTISSEEGGYDSEVDSEETKIYEYQESADDQEYLASSRPKCEAKDRVKLKMKYCQQLKTADPQNMLAVLFEMISQELQK